MWRPSAGTNLIVHSQSSMKNIKSLALTPHPPPQRCMLKTFYPINPADIPWACERGENVVSPVSLSEAQIKTNCRHSKFANM